MTPEERKAFVGELVRDFMAAKESRSQDVAVWMNMATRYQQIGANMNVAYCVRMAQACLVPAMEPRYVAVEAVA